ncbi:MAG: DUF3846 domain-containing protein [Oscillospiraceae bacterium]|nr:DUF3846 domain-containing protein [Oscillospiraceae bacterium]
MNENKKYVIIIEPKEEPYMKLWLPDYGLFELQSLLGGNIETAPTEREGLLLVVNEEGKNEKLPRNRKATGLLPHYMQRLDYIAGTAVLMKRGAEDLEPLSVLEAERILAAMK